MSKLYSKTLKSKFDSDGYITISEFLNKHEVQNLNSNLTSFISNKVPKMPPKYVFYENEGDVSTLKQMQQLFAYDSYFKEILFESQFTEVAEMLLGEKAIGKELEYFNKPPKLGKQTPPHQDNYYFNLEPPKALTMWLALERVDEENGCLRYLKESHLKGMRPHGRSQTLGFSQGITDYDKKDFEREIPITAQPGDLLVHHSMTVHRADKNNSSNRSRQSMGLVYFAESAKENKTAKEEYLKELENK